jgi:N-methylhydantoinase B
MSPTSTMAQIGAPGSGIRGAASGGQDPFALELVKNALVTIADEMALTVSRTARSFVVKEALDFSTALFLADGEMIAQGTCLPFHLGAMPFAVRAMTKTFAGRIRPGDLFITNDDRLSRKHVPDVKFITSLERACL